MGDPMCPRGCGPMEADFVHNGIGMQQCGPYGCPECHYVEGHEKPWALCAEPSSGDGVAACNWAGEMSALVIDEHGVTHCPECNSTAIVENI